MKNSQPEKKSRHPQQQMERQQTCQKQTQTIGNTQKQAETGSTGRNTETCRKRQKESETVGNTQKQAETVWNTQTGRNGQMRHTRLSTRAASLCSGASAEIGRESLCSGAQSVEPLLVLVQCNMKSGHHADKLCVTPPQPVHSTPACRTCELVLWATLILTPFH